MKPNLLIPLVCLALTACQDPSSYQPSSYFTQLNPAQLLREAGFQVNTSPSNPDERTGNTKTGRSQLLTCGTFTASPSTFSCYKVFQLVQKRTDEAAGGRTHYEGWYSQKQEHMTNPVRITAFYNCGRRHGELHLWLFPSEDESQVGYAVHLTEVPLY